MLTEQDLARWLHAAAERIDVDVDVDVDADTDRIFDAIDAPIHVRRRRRGRGALLAAAACVAIAIGATAVTARRHAGWAPPATLPASTPAPGAFAADVVDPPAWFSALTPGRRPAAERSGTWVSTAIARPVANGFETPIVVSTFDGTWSAMDGAVAATIDGHSYLEATFGTVRVLAVPGTPTVVATGNVDRDVLRSILDGTQTRATGGVHTLRLGALPVGYREIVAPTVLGTDVPDRRTLAATDGRQAINDISDRVDPLLAAAGSGGSLARVDIGGQVGWTGTSPTTPGSLRFVIWSPRPGVVFELDSIDAQQPTGELADLASRTTAIPAAEWDQRHPG